MFRVGTPVRKFLPLFEQIRLSDITASKIWLNAADYKAAQTPLQLTLKMERDIKEKVASGELSLDQNITPHREPTL